MQDPVDLAMTAQRVKEIAAMAGDDESAHSAEDELHRRVLATIANGSTDEAAAALAAEALKTDEIDFDRWYA